METKVEGMFWLFWLPKSADASFASHFDQQRPTYDLYWTREKADAAEERYRAQGINKNGIFHRIDMPMGASDVAPSSQLALLKFVGLIEQSEGEVGLAIGQLLFKGIIADRQWRKALQEGTLNLSAEKN